MEKLIAEYDSTSVYLSGNPNFSYFTGPFEYDIFWSGPDPDLRHTHFSKCLSEINVSESNPICSLDQLVKENTNDRMSLLKNVIVYQQNGLCNGIKMSCKQSEHTQCIRSMQYSDKDPYRIFYFDMKDISESNSNLSDMGVMIISQSELTLDVSSDFVGTLFLSYIILDAEESRKINKFKHKFFPVLPIYNPPVFEKQYFDRTVVELEYAIGQKDHYEIDLSEFRNMAIANLEFKFDCDYESDSVELKIGENSYLFDADMLKMMNACLKSSFLYSWELFESNIVSGELVVRKSSEFSAVIRTKSKALKMKCVYFKPSDELINYPSCLSGDQKKMI